MHLGTLNTQTTRAEAIICSNSNHNEVDSCHTIKRRVGMTSNSIRHGRDKFTGSYFPVMLTKYSKTRFASQINYFVIIINIVDTAERSRHASMSSGINVNDTYVILLSTQSPFCYLT